MIGNNRILAIIPARGGSKGIKKKNIKLFAGFPLLYHSIRVAQKSKYIDKVVVSTENNEIKDIARKYGACIIDRPEEFAKDDSLPVDLIRHTIQSLEQNGENFDYFLLLEPTAPLRTVDIVDSCIEELVKKGADSVATFTESEPSPSRMWRIEGEMVTPFIEGSNPWLPRQKQAVAYQLNGLVYGVNIKKFKQESDSVKFIVGKLLPVVTEKKYTCDIDDEIDFEIAEFLIKKLKVAVI